MKIATPSPKTEPHAPVRSTVIILVPTNGRDVRSIEDIGPLERRTPPVVGDVVTVVDVGSSVGDRLSPNHLDWIHGRHTQTSTMAIEDILVTIRSTSMATPASARDKS